jgi:hypothetical protein
MYATGMKTLYVRRGQFGKRGAKALAVARRC